MKVYGTFAVTGPQGSGKSLICTRIARDFLLDGKLLVTNLNFYLDKLLPYWSKSVYIRVSDYPNVADLWSIGNATDSADESKFGLLIIDEIAVIANARDWKAKDRVDLISYLRQARKHGFNSFYISQDVESIDSQIRKSLVEHVVYCTRTDRVNIPFISALFKTFGIRLKFPLIHIAKVRLGLNKTDLKVDTWTARGTEFYAGYDTKQKFREEGAEIIHHIQTRYVNTPHGYMHWNLPYQITSVCNSMYTVLSAWHLKGRYMTAADKRLLILKKALPIFIITSLLIFFATLTKDLFDYQIKTTTEKQQQSQIPTDTQPTNDIKGVLKNAHYSTILLKDGTIHQTNINEKKDGVTYYKINDSWHALAN